MGTKHFAVIEYLDDLNSLLGESRIVTLSDTDRQRYESYTNLFPLTNAWESEVYNLLYCPKCGDLRRMHIACLFSLNFLGGLRAAPEHMHLGIPALFIYRCVQCNVLFTALMYHGPSGVELAVLPSVAGGLVTPHTPEGVRYYLDQAQRAQNLGANSASLAMYRAALEWLLFDKGYTEGMCGKKISALQKDMEEGRAARWARDLPVPLLRLLSKLGNFAVHPGDGDIAKQAALDRELLTQVKAAFKLLLEKAYEQEAREMALLEELSAKLEEAEG